MKFIECFKGIEIFEKPDFVGGGYYYAPDLTTKIIPVNFTPNIKMLKEFIDRELKDNV